METFQLSLKEDNPKNIILNYSFSKKNLNLIKDCREDESNKICGVYVNLSNQNGKEIEYYFQIEDIAGNIAKSKPITLLVDTKAPKADMNWSLDKRTVSFKFNITEDNFKEITFIDLNETRPKEIRLCSRLKAGICLVKKSFKIGKHNLTILIKDEADNQLKKTIKFIAI